MNKKTLLLLIIAIAAFNIVEAARVSEAQARAIAGKFFNVDMPELPAAMKAKAKRGSVVPYYVFNNPAQPGWVIVAGDDRARSILAYGDEEYFDTDEMPECVQDWLNDYVEQIEALDNATVAEAETDDDMMNSILAGESTKIAPLLSTKWAQGLPYNQQCPSYSTTSGTSYCPAGCVAIAMAQIMYYYKSSYGSIAIPAYTSENDNFTNERPELPATTFDWAIMNPWYNNASSTSNSAKEVQKLVKYCGQAVEMDYGKESSSATSDRNAFVYYFGYDRFSRQYSREDVNATTWANLIYSELAQGRPVYMSARKLSGGHAFICDGYDGAGLFHINWGWRGSNNGFFALNALSDGNTGGTGAASGEEGYTLKMQIIVGLEPSKNTNTNNDYNILSIYKSISAPNGTTYTRTSSSGSFNNVALIVNYYNASCQAYTYDLGWELSDGNGSQIGVYTVLSNKYLRGGYYTYPTSSMSIGSGLTSGTYRLKPVCRISGTSVWHPLRGSGVNYVKAIINNNTLTLQIYDDLSVQNLNINSANFGSVKKVGSPLEINLGVFNNGQTDYNYIYMWANGSLTSATTTDIGIGKSGTVTMYYTPSQAGTNTFRFTADREGTRNLYNTSVNVNAASAASFTANNSASVSGTTINVKSVLKNTGSATYNDYIVAKMWKHRPNSGNTGYGDNCISKTLYLNSGGTSTMNFAFTGLEHGTGYHFSIFYYSNGEQVKAGSSTYTLTPNLYDINEDGAVNASDITTLYDVMLNGDVHYKGYCDLNGDGYINAADITAIYDYMLGN